MHRSQMGFVVDHRWKHDSWRAARADVEPLYLDDLSNCFCSNLRSTYPCAG